MAHITGGGLLENVPRVLPDATVAELKKVAWPRPKLFDWMQQEGNVGENEMHRVFNCGIGMVIVVAAAEAETAMAELAAARGSGLSHRRNPRPRRRRKPRPLWFEPGRRRALARRLALPGGNCPGPSGGRWGAASGAGPGRRGENRKVRRRGGAEIPPGTATRRADAAVGAVSVESTGLHGSASFYGSGLHGRRAASGEGFDAGPSPLPATVFPLGSWVLVRRLDNGRCAVVRINDRMPARQRRRIIDLFRAAAEQLDMIAAGVVLVRAARLRQTPGQGGRWPPPNAARPLRSGTKAKIGRCRRGRLGSFVGGKNWNSPALIPVDSAARDSACVGHGRGIRDQGRGQFVRTTTRTGILCFMTRVEVNL